MDDRQPVSFFRRALSYLISGLIATQPLLPAVAAQITPVTGGTKMDAAGNGVPVVNIATPNQAGLSHNQYQQYNVGKEGLILNNATGQLTKTQLGGLIQNNPNLKAGNEAKAIVNEVIGAGRSQLQGYTEVAGKAANVMVANPYGITCNGCGFINTPNVTLTTGKPQFDAQGNLMSLDVTKGAITIAGQGLDGSQADAVSIISRAAEINAGIYAKDLKVTAGANRVASDGTVTPIAGDGAAPSVAVDTSALGGMYANRIHLVSSEKGVGVNLGNLNARQGDMVLTAEGQLAVNNSLSSGALTAKAQSVVLSGEHKAAGEVRVEGQQGIRLTNSVLTGDGTVTLNGGSQVLLQGSKITAGGNVTLAGASLATEANSRIDGADKITLTAEKELKNAGQIAAGNALAIKAAAVNNSGSLVAKKSLQSRASQLNNSGTVVADTLEIAGKTVINRGEIHAGQQLTLTTENLQQRGMVESKGKATLIASKLLENSAGSVISSDNDLQIHTAVLNNQGTLSAIQLGLQGEDLINGGLLQGTQMLTMITPRFTNLTSGSLTTDGDLLLDLPSLANEGVLSSKGTLWLAGNSLTNSGEINAASLFSDNANVSNLAGGRLSAQDTLQLAAATLDNKGEITGDSLQLSANTLTNQGRLQGKQNASLQAGTLNNQQQGEVLSAGRLTLNADTLNNEGQLQGDQLTLRAVDWQNNGNALSAQDANITIDHKLINHGQILGQKRVDLITAEGDNSGTLIARALTLKGDLINSGLLQGDDSLSVTGGTLNNQTGGKLLSKGDATLGTGTLINSGYLQAETLALKGDEWNNTGTARADGGLTAQLTGTLNNSGTIGSAHSVDLQTASLNNSGSLLADRLALKASALKNSGLIQGNAALALEAQTLNNLRMGQIESVSGLTLDLLSLNNAGQLKVNEALTVLAQTFSNQGAIASAALAVKVRSTLTNGAEGTLLSGSTARLEAEVLENQGTVAAQNLELYAASLANRGMVQGDNALLLSSAHLNNLAAGDLLSGGTLTLSGGEIVNDGRGQAQQLKVIASGLTNRGHLYGIDGLDAKISGRLNNDGELRSQGDASLQGQTLQNAGNILANGLSLDAGSLTSNGLLQGNRQVNAQADDLALTASGRLLTGGKLTLDVGQLTTAGTLQGQQARVDAQAWRHSGSLLASDGLQASVAGELTNQGELLSQGNLVVNAATLTQEGFLLASGDMTLSGNAFSNEGNVQGKTLTLTPARITNRGTLIGLDALSIGSLPQPAGLGRLATAPARLLDNQAGGALLTQGLLTVRGGDISNKGSWQGQRILLAAQQLTNNGSIQSADDMQLQVEGDFTSQGGSNISAGGNAALQALALTNQGEWIASNLTLKADSLVNGGTVSGINGLTLDLDGSFTQQQGKTLLSGGALTLNADTVDNQGRIQGKDLQIVSRTLTNNGQLQGDNGLTLTQSEALINNAAGTLLGPLLLNAPQMRNYGLIQGVTTATLNASKELRNEGTILNDGALTLTTPQLTNSGWLQASALQLSATAANNSGTLLAREQGTLTGNSLTNLGTVQGAQLAVNTGQLANGGMLLGSKGLTITAQQVTQQASGRLYSGGDLWLNSHGLDLPGQLVALGNATLILADSFTGRGTLAAGQTLRVSSNGDLMNNGVMQGQSLVLNAAGALTNNGQLTSGMGDSLLDGNRVALNSSGTLQGGGNVTLTSKSDIAVDGFTGTAGTLTLNSPGAIVNTALLYAAGDLWLLANTIRNESGTVLAGNNLWMQRDRAGNASQEISNKSGTIETQNGDITFATAHLTNQWLSVQEGSTTTENLGDQYLYPSTLPNSYALPLDLFTDEEVNYWIPHGIGEERRIVPLAADLSKNKEVLVASTVSSTQVTGQAGRISAGRDLVGNASRLDNLGSFMLAGRNMRLSGDELNNQSYLSGAQKVWRIFTPDPDYINIYNGTPADYILDTFDRNATSYNGEPVTWVVKEIYYFSTDTYRTENAGSIRGVIQANGDVSSTFSAIRNNSESTDVRGTIMPTLTAPGLATLAQQQITGGATQQALTAAQSVAVGSSEWRDRLSNALQQVIGGGELASASGQSAALGNYAAGSVQPAGVGKALTLGENPYNQQRQEMGSTPGRTVDISAYPLPQNANDYFTVSNDPKSPYLITVNPKLDGLGKLDKTLYSDLYHMLGQQPASAPEETRQQYTSESAFIGSSYLLDRLDLKPDYDYRLLGDAAFDTRYVSNAMLSQTGSRYLNGIGSDLDQMKYLMDNAAAAQQSLGLKAGVTLSADQIASLDRSILWWEASSINGQTVLVPKLYLAPGDITVNNGSVIAGANVVLEGNTVSNNGSTLLAQQGLAVNSLNTLDNLNASLIKAGGNLQLSALNDINNIGSAISGKQVALESLKGSINNLTLTHQVEKNSAYGNSLATQQGATSVISSLDALTLNAGKDITLKSASIKAGGDTLLKAGQNVAFLANQESVQINRDRASYDRTSSTASHVQAGGALKMVAGGDLTVEASHLDAGKNALLQAGNDLNLLSAAKESHEKTRYHQKFDETIDRTTLTSGGDLSLASGRDLTSQAASMGAEGNVALQAGRDVALQAAASGEGHSLTWTRRQQANETLRQQGTEIASGGNTTIAAGRDIVSNAGEVTAQGDVALNAGRDITLNTATERDYSYQQKNRISSGFGSIKTTRTVQEDSVTTEKGTLLSGDNVSVKAGNNLLVKGSQVVGDNAVTLQAGNNVDIVAATNTQSRWRSQKSKTVGMTGTGGLGVSAGSSKSLYELREKGTTQSQSTSTVGSNAGSVTVKAGGEVHISGADLIARKGLTLQGDSVLIEPGRDKRTSDERFGQSTSGLTLALSGAVGDSINNAVATAQAAKQESNGRLSALQSTKTVLSGVQAWQAQQLDAASAGKPDNGSKSTVGIMLSYSSQSAKSHSHAEEDRAFGSTLSAGDNLQITATGKGQSATSGDITVAGSQLKAGGDASLNAARDITLISSSDTNTLTGTHSSHGGTVGMGLTAGSGGTGLTISASMNAASGSEKGNGTSWNETTLDAGKQVSLNSGRDTSLIGAQVSGDRVVAEVGRDLTLTSQQDSNDYNSKQHSMSAGGSFTFGVGGSANFSYSRDKITSTFDSVNEQTGIYAGKGGFVITTGNHTQLNGAVIASQAEASKNSLDTGTLGFTDINNQADFKTAHQGGGLSSGAGATLGKNLMGNMANALIAGTSGNGHTQGTTQSAVAEGNIIIRDRANQQQEVADLSRDTGNANDSISPIFNKEKEQQRLQAAQLIGDIGSQMADIAHTQGQIGATRAANEKMAALSASERQQQVAAWRKDHPGSTATDQEILAQQWQKSYDVELKNSGFGTGSKVQQAITAATAAVQGLAGGNLAAAAAGGAAPYIAEIIGHQSGLSDQAKVMAHAVVNAALAAASGKNALAGGTGAAVGELTGMLSKEIYGKDPADLNETEKQELSVLATLASGLAGGLVGDSSASALTGAQAGKVTVENNWLSDHDIVTFTEKYAKAKTEEEKAQLVVELKKLDVQQQGQALATAIPVNEQKAELAKLKVLATSSGCNTQCQQLVAYSISELEPVANNRELHQNNLRKAVLSSVILALTVDKPLSGSIKASQGTVTAALDDILKNASSAVKPVSASAGKTISAERGAVANANFAQSKIRANESFSAEGADKYSKMAGVPVTTVDDLANAITKGLIKPDQLPVDFVDMNGARLILNTRTSVALDRAGIAKSDWFGVNQTNVKVQGMEGKTYNDLAADQLMRNKLPETGSPELPRGRK